MNVATRAVRSGALVSRRNFVTATKPKLGDHHHGPHTVFDGKPFSKASAGAVVWGVTFLGIVIPLFNVSFQQKKHGFPQQK